MQIDRQHGKSREGAAVRQWSLNGDAEFQSSLPVLLNSGVADGRNGREPPSSPLIK